MSMINVRGAVNALENGEEYIFHKKDPQVIRNTVYGVKKSTGKDFVVNIIGDYVKVTRTK